MSTQNTTQGNHGSTRMAKTCTLILNYYVGGNTKFYGGAAQLFRRRKEDFAVLRHHGGISPAWPIAYEEMEPYYTEAEHLYRVHGQSIRGPHRTANQRLTIAFRPSAMSRGSKV